MTESANKRTDGAAPGHRWSPLATVHSAGDLTASTLAGATGRGAWFRERPVLSTVLGTGLIVLLLAPFAIINPSPWFGLPGALAVAVALGVAVVVGPLPGAAVAVAGGIFFSFAVADPDHPFRRDATVLTVVVWVLLALAAGLVADRLRRRLIDAFDQIADREAEVRLTLESTAAAVGLFTGPDLRCRNANALLRALFARPDWQQQPLATLLPDLDPEVLTALRTCALDRQQLQHDEILLPTTKRYFSLTARCSSGHEEDTLLLTLSDVTPQQEAATLHKRLEESLLPRVAVTDERLHVAFRYRPGEARMLIGGDFMGTAELGDGTLALAIGDVSGHGPDAAALGATLRASWRALALTGMAPLDLVQRLDGILRRDVATSTVFATLCCAWVNPARDKLTLVLAGHHRPLLLAADAAAEPEAPFGPPLGLLEEWMGVDGPPWQAADFPLAPGWALLLYTDGLVEGYAAPDARERFGVERLAPLLDGAGAATCLDARALDDLLDRVQAANGQPFGDDVAVLLVCHAGADGGGS